MFFNQENKKSTKINWLQLKKSILFLLEPYLLQSVFQLILFIYYLHEYSLIGPLIGGADLFLFIIQHPFSKEWVRDTARNDGERGLRKVPEAAQRWGCSPYAAEGNFSENY